MAKKNEIKCSYYKKSKEILNEMHVILMYRNYTNNFLKKNSKSLQLKMTLIIIRLIFFKINKDTFNNLNTISLVR